MTQRSYRHFLSNLREPHGRGGGVAAIDAAPLELDDVIEHFAQVEIDDLRTCWVPAVVDAAMPWMDDKAWGGLVRALMVVSRRLYACEFKSAIQQEISIMGDFVPQHAVANKASASRPAPVHLRPSPTPAPPPKPAQSLIVAPSPSPSPSPATMGGADWEVTTEGGTPMASRGGVFDEGLLQALKTLGPLPQKIRLKDGKKTWAATRTGKLIAVAQSLGAPKDLVHLCTADGCRVVYRAPSPPAAE